MQKNPEHSFVDIGKWETCPKTCQTTLNFMAVGARQSFQFLRQNTWFLENSRALSKFLCGILHYFYQISFIKL